MKLQLFLENYEVELNKEVQFSLNKVYEDLSMPTDVIVDYSKSVTIPFSKHNCKVLGNVYRIDKVITPSPHNIGSNIDPSRKIPAKLIYNGEVVFDGYAKFVSSNISTKSSTFTINLFGMIGEIFHKLKSIVVSRDKLTEEQKQEEDNGDKYLLHDHIDPNWRLNSNYVMYSWRSQGNDSRPVIDSNTNPVDIIGFAPAYRGQYGDFKSDKIEIVDTAGKHKIISTTEWAKIVITAKLKEKDPGILDSEIEKIFRDQKPDELAQELICDYQWREYRAYGLRPYIYLNKIFAMYIEKCKELTGYDIILDKDWFNESNFSWSRMCYMLDFIENRGTKDTSRNMLFNWHTGKSVKELPAGDNVNRYWQEFTYDLLSGIEMKKTDKFIRLNPFRMTLKNKTYMEDLTNFVNLQPMIYAYPDRGGRIIFNFDLYEVWKDSTGQKTEKLNFTKLFWHGNKSDISGVYTEENYLNHEYYNTVAVGTTSYRYDYYDIPVITIPDEIIAKTHGGTAGVLSSTLLWRVTCRLEAAGHRNEKLSPYFDLGNLYYVNKAFSSNPKLNSEDFNLKNNEVTYNLSNKIGMSISLSNIYFDDKPLFDVMLSYTKMFGLIWDVDYAHKELHVMTKKNYFKNYNISVWDSKIDKSRDFIVEPISFPTPVVSFNYEDLDGYRYSGYKNKYGVNYCEKIIKTNYNFSTEKTDLFKDCYPSCVATNTFLKVDDILNWDVGKEVISSPDDKVMMCCADEEQENAITAYNWYIRGKNYKNMQQMRITDDTELMLTNEESCWSDSNANPGEIVDYIPAFNIVVENPKTGVIHSCVFNCPNEDYTKDNSLNKLLNNAIYDKFWKDYINERYNIQNKKITCYVFITQQEFKEFKFRNFVLIGEQLFMINKIFDFDMNSNFSSTKVELVQITNINSYIQ